MKIKNGEAINGDCLEVMKTIPDKSIDLVLTSPPYDNLRSYNNNSSWNFEAVAKELFRVTRIGGVIVWVVGDETKNFCESLTSFKQALFFCSIGFRLLDTMIYYKQNYAPAYPTLRRYANQFEYMFIFSKGKPKTFNPKQELKKEHRNGNTSFRKRDGTKITKFIVSKKNTKNASNVWSYPMGNKTINHPAVFPEGLAEDHILSWSNPGEFILDPFAGSFTTGKMAEKNNRKWVCIEKDIAYFELGIKRIENET